MNLRERVAAGERAALGEAFERYRPLARKMLTERGRASADIDDLIQDSFILLPECARRCAPETTIGGCVATAVRQAIRGFDCRMATSDQTAHGRPTRRVELAPRAVERFRDASPLPDQVLELRERVHLVSGLVEQLGPRSRQILIARERDLLEPAAIAARMRLSPDTIATRLCRARRELERLARAA